MFLNAFFYLFCLFMTSLISTIAEDQRCGCKYREVFKRVAFGQSAPSLMNARPMRCQFAPVWLSEREKFRCCSRADRQQEEKQQSSSWTWRWRRQNVTINRLKADIRRTPKPAKPRSKAPVARTSCPGWRSTGRLSWTRSWGTRRPWAAWRCSPERETSPTSSSQVSVINRRRDKTESKNVVLFVLQTAARLKIKLSPPWHLT